MILEIQKKKKKFDEVQSYIYLYNKHFTIKNFSAIFQQ